MRASLSRKLALLFPEVLCLDRTYRVSCCGGDNIKTADRHGHDDRTDNGQSYNVADCLATLPARTAVALCLKMKFPIVHRDLSQRYRFGLRTILQNGPGFKVE